MISYFNKFKTIALALSTSLFLNSLSCTKIIKVDEYLRSESESKILETKSEKNLEYKIKEPEYFYDSNTLSFQVNGIAKNQNYNITEKKSYSIHNVGEIIKYDGKSTGLATGITGGLASLLTSIILFANPSTKTECMDYYASSGMTQRCETNSEFSIAGLLVLLLGVPASILTGVGLSKINKTYQKDLKEEKRDFKTENLKIPSTMDFLYNKPLQNIPVQIISNPALFDGKNSIKLKTDKEGKIATKIKLPEGLTFDPEQILNFPKIIKLKDYNMADEAEKVINHIKNDKRSCSFAIKTLTNPQEKGSFNFNCYMIPEKEILEELIKQ